jgi:pimeloyl-ACP methyl ester carboxylesterase
MTRKLIAGTRALVLGALLFSAVAIGGVARAEPRFQPVPRAVIADPARDPKHHPPTWPPSRSPTGGVTVNALMYLASGEQPHPTLLFLHGFPGNETNIDLLQAVRRAGWNVLKINYRGSWGSPGKFSFANARADGEAAVAFLRDPANAAKYHIDTGKRIVVAGHSMGGFMAADAVGRRAAVAGTVLIDAWDIGKEAAGITESRDPQGGRRGHAPRHRPLAGTSPELLVKEIETTAAKLDLEVLSAKVADRPLLVIGAEYAGAPTSRKLAAAARAAGAKA